MTRLIRYPKCGKDILCRFKQVVWWKIIFSKDPFIHKNSTHAKVEIFIIMKYHTDFVIKEAGSNFISDIDQL